MIELEFTDEEPDLVLRKSGPGRGDPQPASNPPEKEASQPHGQLIDIESIYRSQTEQLNAAFPEHQTLMPYTCTLVLDDLSFKRYVFMQVIARHVGDLLADIKLILLQPSEESTQNRPMVLEFSRNRHEALKKFHDLFFEFTFNPFEERTDFDEKPGKFRLTEELPFCLHGAKVASFSEERNQWSSKSKFVALKLINFEQVDCDEPQIPFERLLGAHNVDALEKALGLETGFIFRLSSHKISNIWGSLGSISKEFRSKTPRKHVIGSILGDLNLLLFGKNERNYVVVSSFFELLDLSKKVRLVADAVHAINTVNDLYQLFQSGDTFAKFITHNAINSLKIDKSTEFFDHLGTVFTGTYSSLGQFSRPTIDSVFELNFARFKRRFAAFDSLKKMYLWKAFDCVSFASFLYNRCFFYREEPAELSGSVKSGLSFYDCSSKAIQSLPFADRNRYFLVMFEVAVGSVQNVVSLEQIPFPSYEHPTIKLCGRWDGDYQEDRGGITYAKGLTQGAAQTPFAFNEFVVFDSNQYLPKFLFTFK
jgi:hypothetical protein